MTILLWNRFLVVSSEKHYIVIASKQKKIFSKVLKHTLTSIITNVRILFSWTRHRINSRPTISIKIRKTPSRELNSNGLKTKGLVRSQKDFLIFPKKVSILKCVPEYDILSVNICLNTYKKTLNLNNYGSLFKVYSDVYVWQNLVFKALFGSVSDDKYFLSVIFKGLLDDKYFF